MPPFLLLLVAPLRRRSNSTAVVTSSGEVYTFGCGKDGRLGHGAGMDAPNQDVPRAVAGLTHVASVAVGEYHMAALTTDGTLFTFGKVRVCVPLCGFVHVFGCSNAFLTAFLCCVLCRTATDNWVTATRWSAVPPL